MKSILFMTFNQRINEKKPVIFEGHGKLEYGIRPHFSDCRL